MTGEQSHVLVVDDDDRLRELLRKFLAEQGFMVSTARDAADARAKIGAVAVDLVVLDVMMPGESGLSLATELRRSRDVGILMLTAMGETEDRIRGLEGGADDYLSKPFEPRELVLRINAVLRRRPRAAPAMEIGLGACRFHVGRGELSRDGVPVRLTAVEAALLAALAEQPGLVMSRDELAQRTGAPGGGRAIDVQVTRLRRKVEPDPRLPRYLKTVRGLGYQLTPD